MKRRGLQIERRHQFAFAAFFVLGFVADGLAHGLFPSAGDRASLIAFAFVIPFVAISICFELRRKRG